MVFFGQVIDIAEKADMDRNHMNMIRERQRSYLIKNVNKTKQRMIR